MGHIYFGIPQELVLKLIEVRPTPNFVETGTFRGGTSFWAGGHFKNVFTIEVNPELSRQAAATPGRPKNVEFLTGDSALLMGPLVKRLKGPALFWLDGHYSGPGTGGESNECPLLAEMEAASKAEEPIILIDDARCFLGPLPPPHKQEWPGIAAIFKSLAEKFPRHYATILDDVIIAVPEALKPVLDEDWLAHFWKRFPAPPKKRSIQTVAATVMRQLKPSGRG